MWIFICFNFFMVFVGTWLHLGGARKIKSMLSPQARRDRREANRKRQGYEV